MEGQNGALWETTEALAGSDWQVIAYFIAEL